MGSWGGYLDVLHATLFNFAHVLVHFGSWLAGDNNANNTSGVDKVTWKIFAFHM